MIAQINLYHPRFRKKEALLPFSQMVIITFLAMMIIPGMFILNEREISKLSAQSTMLKADYNRLEGEWKEIQNILSQRKPDSTLTADSIKLETILEHRAELVQFIKDNSFNNNRGYSDYLIALARQHTKNIWLTSINIKKNGTALSIEGKIVNGATLPLYLKRLSNEPILTGTQFTTFKITQDSDDPSGKSPLNFNIASTSNSQK